MTDTTAGWTRDQIVSQLRQEATREGLPQSTVHRLNIAAEALAAQPSAGAQGCSTALLLNVIDTLKPFAEVADKLRHCHVVEICEPHADNPSPNIVPMPREWFERAADDLEAAAIRLHCEGVLSEGQASKMTGLDRVEVRKLADATPAQPDTGDEFCGVGWVFDDDDGHEYSLDHPDARGSTVENLRRSTPQEDHLYALWQSAITSPDTGDVAALREALLDAWTDFLDANPDDLTSPGEWPDHALVTVDQMIGIVENALAAMSKPNAQGRGEG